jgi:hypothetical protein
MRGVTVSLIHSPSSNSAKELFLAAKEKFIATNNKQLELFCVSEVRTRGLPSYTAWQPC